MERTDSYLVANTQAPTVDGGLESDARRGTPLDFPADVDVADDPIYVSADGAPRAKRQSAVSFSLPAHGPHQDRECAWIPSYKPGGRDGKGAIRLFCFPWAGGTLVPPAPLCTPFPSF